MRAQFRILPVVCAALATVCGAPTSKTANQIVPPGSSTPALPPAAIFTPNPNLRVSIRVSSDVVRIGEQPAMTVRFENTGTGELSFLPPIVHAAYVEDDRGNAIPSCSTIVDSNPRFMTAKDLIRLASSQGWETTITPVWHSIGSSPGWPMECGTQEGRQGLTLLAPGTYRVRYVYVNYPDLPYLHYDPAAMPPGLWEGKVQAPATPLQVVALEPAQERDLIARVLSVRPANAEIVLLGLQNTQAAADALLARFRSRPADRLLIMRALEHTSVPGVLATLLKLIEQPSSPGDPNPWSMELASLMRRRGGCEVRPFFDRALNTTRGDLDYLFRTVVAPVTERCPAFGDDVRRAVTDPQRSPSARAHAALLLSKLPDASSARSALVELATDTRQSLMARLALIAALGDVGSAEVVPALKDLTRSPEPSLASRAIHALVQVGDTSAVPELAGLLSHADPHIRNAAASALRRLGDDSVVPAMRKAAEDGDRDVRTNALFFLAEHGDAASLPLFERHAGSPNQYLREAARAGLRRTGTAASVDAIRPLLNGSDEALRRSTVLALEELTFRPWQPADGRRELNPRDFDAWAGNKSGSRRAWALAALDQPFANTPWRYSPERRMASLALTYLGASADPALKPVFARLAESVEPAVRIGAAEAMAVLDRPLGAQLLVREFDARYLDACVRANDVLKKLTGKIVPVDCEDPESRQKAKAQWAPLVATGVTERSDPAAAARRPPSSRSHDTSAPSTQPRRGAAAA